MQTSPGKVAPQSLEAEVAVLGGVLLDATAIDRVVEIISGEDFYREAHRKIFRAALDLVERQQPVDLVTITELLKTRGELTEVGGAAYVSELTDRAVTSANVAYYARIIRQKAVLRRLIGTATEIITGSYEGQENVDEFVDKAEHSIFEIAEKKIGRGFIRAGDLMGTTFKHIEQLYERKEMVTGVATGFTDLDRKTAGLQPSDLIIVAGRPSMGKTAFALGIAEHAAIENRVGVGIFSLEMSNEQLVMRMLCSQAGIDLNRLRTGYLSAKEFPALAKAAGRISDAPIYIDDTPASSSLELRAKARRLKREKSANLGLIVVDYLQLMRGAGSTDSREQEISEISRSLKALAKELQIPVIALSQLNRKVEDRQPPKPRMSNLRECVTGDTLVCASDGRRIPISELVGGELEVISVDRRGKACRSRSGPIWSVGRRPIVQMALAGGRSLRATPEHRVKAQDGWRALRHLRSGDRVAVLRHTPAMRTLELTTQAMVARPGTVPDYAVFLVDAEFRGHAEADLSWDRVLAVRDAGEEEVFDLSVPGTECWLADGIVSHNSGAIEQDADVILFIYRDEVYNPNSQDKGKAEIIIGKQRNGPIGEITLAFRSEYTRFENYAEFGEVASEGAESAE